MKKDLKCAIVEYEDYHDQVIPSMVYALNKLGVAVDVYLTQNAMENRVFCYDVEDFSYTIKPIEGMIARMRERSLKYREYNFVIFNTLEPNDKVDTLKRIQNVIDETTPLIGVIHHTHVLSPALKEFCHHKNRYPLVLAKHIVDHLKKQNIHAHWIPFAYHGQVNKEKFKKLTFCIPGILAPTRKDYSELLDAIECLANSGKDFQVYFVGRNYYKESEAFKKLLDKRDIRQYCVFTEGFIDYKEFYEIVAASHFIISHVDIDQATKESLHKYKVTSSLYTAAGLGVIPIVDRHIAAVYALEHAGLVHDNDLASAMETASDLTRERIQFLIQNLDMARESMLRDTVKNMESLIKTILS
jgi:L-rhamnose mutarotase